MLKQSLPWIILCSLLTVALVVTNNPKEKPELELTPVQSELIYDLSELYRNQSDLNVAIEQLTNPQIDSMIHLATVQHNKYVGIVRDAEGNDMGDAYRIELLSTGNIIDQHLIRFYAESNTRCHRSKFSRNTNASNLPRRQVPWMERHSKKGT